MLMLGPVNATRCTWLRLLSSFCLVPDRTHGVPGILPAELEHYLWDLSDLSEVKLPSPTGDSLSLTEEVLQLNPGSGGHDGGSGGEARENPKTHLKHGLQVGILASFGKKPSLRLNLATKAMSMLPHIYCQSGADGIRWPHSERPSAACQCVTHDAVSDRGQAEGRNFSDGS